MTPEDESKQRVMNNVKELLRMYVESHRNPGRFLRSVLVNNFVDAVLRADEEYLTLIREIALYVHNELPTYVWGSQELVRGWLACREGEECDYKREVFASQGAYSRRIVRTV